MFAARLCCALVSLFVTPYENTICSVFHRVELLKVNLLSFISSQTVVRTIVFWHMFSKYMLWAEDGLTVQRSMREKFGSQDGSEEKV